MALNLPTFYKRTASAVVFAAVMLVGLLWNIPAFAVLMCLVAILCLRDYLRLMQKTHTDTYWPAWLPVAIQATGVCFMAIFFLNDTSASAASKILFLFLPVIPAILLLASCLPKKNALPALLKSLGGLLYITLPVILLYLMRLNNFILPIALILMIWTNDTMAYLVGSFIGKHSFSPISPNKTWEGVVGGALLTIIGACLYGYFSASYRLMDWMALGLCATVAGTLGDLLESKLKRMANVKDSGTLMPGHGGALDRFDSLLIAAPFAFVYANYFMR